VAADPAEEPEQVMAAGDGERGGHGGQGRRMAGGREADPTAAVRSPVGLRPACRLLHGARRGPILALSTTNGKE
jgi:hypothetical protein